MVTVAEYRAITDVEKRKCHDRILQWLLKFWAINKIFYGVVIRQTTVGVLEVKTSDDFVYDGLYSSAIKSECRATSKIDAAFVVDVHLLDRF